MNRLGADEVRGSEGASVTSEAGKAREAVANEAACDKRHLGSPSITDTRAAWPDRAFSAMVGPSASPVCPREGEALWRVAVDVVIGVVINRDREEAGRRP
jgi:hypothetical protein